MLDRYRCPHCKQACEIDLAVELETGETDLRRVIDDRQKLKLDLPRKVMVQCRHCNEEFIAETVQIVP